MPCQVRPICQIQLRQPTPIKTKFVPRPILEIKVLGPDGLQHGLEMHHTARIDGRDARAVLIRFSLLVPRVTVPVPGRPTQDLLDVDVEGLDGVGLDTYGP